MAVQLRRNTDRKVIHRLAQFALAVVCILTAKLIDWRNRWSPMSSPIAEPFTLNGIEVRTPIDMVLAILRRVAYSAHPQH